MKWLLFPFRQIWKLYYAIVFTITFIFLYPAFYYLLYKESRYPSAFKLKRAVALFSVYFSGIFISTKKETELFDNQNYVFCCNHTSYLDIVLTYCIIKPYFVFMAKKELLRVPLFGNFFKDMDIAVDRKSRIGSHKAFLRAGQDLDKGHSIVMFPEGTIAPDAPIMRNFKNGPFKLAIEKQVPIVPITFLSNYKILPAKNNFIKYGGPGIARVIIHEPIKTAGMTENDLVPLRSKVHSIINNAIKENED